MEYINSPLSLAEKRVLVEHLKKYKGNVKATAKALLISRETVSRLVKMYEIPLDKIRKGENFHDSV